MKIKKIETSPINSEDIEFYKLGTSKLKGFWFTSNDINFETIAFTPKRIVSLRVIGDNDLILVNPKLLKTSDNSVIYFEKDTIKANKVRKTVRYTSVIIDTDNLGQVEFKPTNEKQKWENSSHFMEDAGLLECVLVQRAIDAIDGIDITSPQRAYSQTVITKKRPGRNERVMIQSPEGETLFIKYKSAETYIQQGYSLL